MKTNFFPPMFRIIGIVMLIIGLVLSFFYFYPGFRIESPAFAIISSYFQTRFFTVIKTNIADEIILLCLLAGFFFTIFSKDKPGREIKPEYKDRAMLKAVFINSIVQIFGTLFLYGQAFIGLLVLNLFLVPALYLLMLKRDKDQPKPF